MKPAPSVLPPPAPLRWRILRLERGLGEHAQAWQALQQTLPLQHPMLDARYIDTLLRHYGQGDERLCVLDDGSAPQAMTILRPGGLGAWTSFLPAQTQVGPHLMRHLDQAAGLARALPGWVERVELLSVDPAVTADPAPGAGMPECLPQALTVNVELDGDFERYWSSRPSKLRDRLRKLERTTLTEQGPLRLVDCTGDEVIAAVRRYAALEGAGWKGQAGTALTPGGAQEAFYLELLERFAGTGEARVLELWCGERLVASRLLLMQPSCMAILKTTYDEGFRRYGPGRLLLARLVEHAHRLPGIERVEFCTNATHDQMYWITGRRQVCHWTVFRSTRAAATHRLLRAALGCWRGRQPAPDGQATPHEAGEAAVGVAVHSTHASLPPGAGALLDEQAGADIGLGAAWFAQLEQGVFGHGGAGPAEGGAVRYLVLSHGTAVVAVLPLVHERGRGGVRASSLSSIYTALYAPALEPWLSPADLLPLVRALRAQLAPLASLTLAPIALDAASTRTLQAALALDGFAVFPYFCFVNWTLKPPAHWADYLAARPGALRSTIQRATRRLQAQGGRIEIVSHGGDAERALAAFQHVYARSWKVPEPFPAFIPGLVALCARQGWLRLGIAWLGEQPIAAQLWIVAHGRAAIFKLAYDEAHKKLAPGTALTAQLMRHVLEHDGVQEVDYLIGDDAYKRDWMNQRRERWGLVAYNPRTLAGLGGALGETAARALKPWLERLRARRGGPSGVEG